ncbi:MAG: Asp23/Gls24 family envelope stress response protein [Clostridia bacterium]|nr:Asp23/Gls24 family envelope stress response protein [Clostridia bacterium]
MKQTMNLQDINRYTNMIVSFVNTAIAQTEGVLREYDVVKSKLGVKSMNTKNIRVYFDEDQVVLDIYISVLYGYAVPEVVCRLQENVIAIMKASTPFEVKEVNVNVTNVIMS